MSFNGLAKEHLFEVQCDRRQLPLFNLFLEDWQTLEAKGNENDYSGSFLLLREASLIWREPKQVIKKKKKVAQQPKSQSAQQAPDVQTQQANKGSLLPWNRYRLELHCTIDTQRLTIEGTEQIRKEKLARKGEELEDRKSKNNAEDKQQIKALHREQSKQTRLENSKHFRRLNRPLYQGNADILVGVSFNLTAPATVAVVKGSTGETLTFRSVRQLLGEHYRLLNRQQQRQQGHAQQRRKNQQKGKSQHLSESELGQYIDRLLAKAVIT